MTGFVRKTMTLAILAASLPVVCMAQENAPGPSLTDRGASEDSAAAADKNRASHPPQQELKPTVEQEIEALKKRISELESQVKADHAAVLADSGDAASLK